MSLNGQWAWTQVEAMADRSLTGAEQERMRAAMRGDPELRAAVERARALRRELRKLDRAPLPAGLLRRLWRIPKDSRAAWPMRSPLWVAASIAVVAIAVTVALSLTLRPTPSPLDEQRLAAVRDFETAMTYLQWTAQIASLETNQAVTYGIQEALATSRNAIQEQTRDLENGD